MSILKRAWWWFFGLLRPRDVYATETVTEFPDTLEPECVYLVGEESVPWFAALLCPCGCGALIRLSLLIDDRPRWRARRHFAGTVTLEPSIWRKRGCGSHFFVRRGQIVWAANRLTPASENSPNNFGPNQR